MCLKIANQMHNAILCTIGRLLYFGFTSDRFVLVCVCICMFVLAIDRVSISGIDRG